MPHHRPTPAVLDDDKLAKVKRLAALAKEWGMETSQLALAYMLSLPGMGPVIPSASSVKQVESNAAAGKVSLSAEQRARAAKALGEEG